MGSLRQSRSDCFPPGAFDCLSADNRAGETKSPVKDFKPEPAAMDKQGPLLIKLCAAEAEDEDSMEPASEDKSPVSVNVEVVTPNDVREHNERKLNEFPAQLAPTKTNHQSLKSTMATAKRRASSGSFDCVPNEWPKAAGPV